MSDASVRRTQAERRNHSEEALLDAAAELIAERGIDRASLATIGGRAGLSRGLPTHYFGSKDSLVAQVARHAQDRVTAATLMMLNQDQHRLDELSALELVRLTVDTYLGLSDHPTAYQRALIVMWGSTFPADSSVDGMLDADQRSYDGWADLIARGQREGSIRIDMDPASAAVVLLGFIRGVAAQLFRDSGVADIDDIRKTCSDWIDAALAPAAESLGPVVPDGR